MVRTRWVSSTARPVTFPSTRTSNTVTTAEGSLERAILSTAATWTGVAYAGRHPILAVELLVAHEGSQRPVPGGAQGQEVESAFEVPAVLALAHRLRVLKPIARVDERHVRHPGPGPQGAQPETTPLVLGMEI